MEHCSHCMDNRELDDKISWSYLVNTFLVNATQDRNEKGKSNKEVYTGELEIVWST